MGKKISTSVSSSSQEQQHSSHNPLLLQKKKADDDQRHPPFDEKSARMVSLHHDYFDINDNADAFIRRFRKKLEVQCADTIKDYHQD